MIKSIPGVVSTLNILKRLLKAKPVLPLLLLLLLISSCIPEIRREPIVVSPQYQDTPVVSAPLLPRESINRKIAFLEKILMNDNISEEDRIIAYDMLSVYKDINTILVSSTNNTDSRELVRLLFNNLDILDEKYFSRTFKTDKGLYQGVADELSSTHNKILHAYFAGDFQGVITECISMEAKFGANSLTPDIGLVFAVALAEKDMKEDAIRISERIIHDLEDRPDIIHLRAHLIGWLLDKDQRDKAQISYEKLLDNLDEREAILQEARAKILVSDEQESPSGIPDIKEHPVAETNDQKTDVIAELLVEVGKLVENNLFNEAKLLLLKNKLRAYEGQEMETIENAMKTVEAAEEKYLEDKGLEDVNVKRVEGLIEKERFEEAISSLDKLEASPAEGNVQDKADRLRDLAVEGLIHSERERAAKLFYMAKQSKDISKKEELLLSTSSILNNLIEKYPLNSLINKLNDNLKSVQDELDKLEEER